MNIPDIILHKTAEAQLDSLIQTPPHAVLLAGPLGSGKIHIAQFVAATLIGVTETSLENQPYYRVVKPDEKGSIGIEAVRSLIGFFKLKVPGNQAVNRVAIIEDADAMGREAQNALLKLLEEPPEASVLILTSSRPQSLLPTIRSRVQLLQLAGPTAEQLQQHFSAAGYTETVIRSTLLRTGTNVAEAMRILQTNTDAADPAIDLVKQVLGGTGFDRMLLVDGLSKQKEAANTFINTLASVAQASLETAAAKGAGTVQRWAQVLQAAHTAQDAYERNGNSKLVLTELMLAL